MRRPHPPGQSFHFSPVPSSGANSSGKIQRVTVPPSASLPAAAPSPCTARTSGYQARTAAGSPRRCRPRSAAVETRLASCSWLRSTSRIWSFRARPCARGTPRSPRGPAPLGSASCRHCGRACEASSALARRPVEHSAAQETFASSLLVARAVVQEKISLVPCAPAWPQRSASAARAVPFSSRCPNSRGRLLLLALSSCAIRGPLGPVRALVSGEGSERPAAADPCQAVPMAERHAFDERPRTTGDAPVVHWAVARVVQAHRAGHAASRSSTSTTFGPSSLRL